MHVTAHAQSLSLARQFEQVTVQLWRGPQAVWKLKGEPLVSQGPHERIPGYSDAWIEAGKWGIHQVGEAWMTEEAL